MVCFRRSAGGAKTAWYDHEGDDADGHVDEEDPVPREVVDEESAEQRPEHGRDAEDAPHQPGVAPAVARRDDVADRSLRADHQCPAAEPLERAEEHQRRHAPCASPQSTDPSRKVARAT